MISINNFKKGIVIIPTQGLGNRLRMMASGYALSNFFNIPLNIIWNPAPDCNAQFDELFKPNLFNIIDNNILNANRYLFHGFVHTSTFINDIHNLTTGYDYLVIIGGHEFMHRQMNINNFIYLKHEFYNSLQFSDQVNDILTNYDNLLKNNFIGVHIRTFSKACDTDDVLNPKFNNTFNPINFEQNSPITQFFNIIDNLKNDNINLLVLSNNTDVIQVFKDRYPNRNIFNTSTCLFERNNSFAIIYSLVEFILLSKSKLIIGTYFSSFSDEATFFKLIPKITPVSDIVKIQQQLPQIYHCHNFSILHTPNNSYYGINLNNYHLLKYFK